MDEQGLAQGLTGQAGPSMVDMQQKMQGGPAAGAPEVEAIIELLIQGITPEELVKQGVPEELVMAAIQMLEEQTMQAEQGGQPGGEPMPVADASGLASMVTRPV